MIILLFFVFLLFLSEINSYKISFKKFIKKKTLETNYSGENDTIEILNNIQKSAIQIRKILSLSYLENINLESNDLNVHQEKQKNNLISKKNKIIFLI